MTQQRRTNCLQPGRPAIRLAAAGVWILAVAMGLASIPCLRAQASPGQVEDLTGNYQFLGPHDNLALLQEEGMIKGYIDVMQGDSESDALLSFTITMGSRKGDHVEFRTQVIHEKYYRFSGIVRRGKASRKGQPDYSELAGTLLVVEHNSVTEKDTVDRRQVVFKSKGGS